MPRRAYIEALLHLNDIELDIGGDIGQSLVGAFQSAENAVGQFVRTGKLNFRDLVTSLLADLAQLAAHDEESWRRTIAPHLLYG